MRVEAEFTTEPFKGEGEPPEHATAALEAARAAGLECEFGPLGTSVRGERDAVLATLAAIAAAGLDHGADQITAPARPAGRAAPRRPAAGLDAHRADVADALGGDLRTLDRPAKQRAVRVLEERGAFEFRKSAEIVAEALGVTRFTVYNYLNRERD